MSDDVLVESFESGHSVAASCTAAVADKLAVASKVARNAIKTASAEIKDIAQEVQLAVQKVAEEETWVLDSEGKGRVQPLGEVQARHVVKTGKETYLQMLPTSSTPTCTPGTSSCG